MISRTHLITGLLFSLALVGGQQAQAANHKDLAAGVAVGAIIGGVIASQRPTQVYTPAPVYRAPPPPATYYPRPIYIERPVYYRSGPAYYIPAPHRYKHWHKPPHRHGHRW